MILPRPNHRLATTWLTLLALTFVGLGLAESSLARPLITTVALAAAVAKGRLILLEFLELRSAPGPWRAILVAWLALIAVAAWGGAMLPLLRA